MTAKPRRRKTNVLSLRGAAIPVPHVNADCVKESEQLVDMAAAGHVAGIVWAIVSPEGHIKTGYAGNADAHSMVAASAILANRIVQLEASMD